MAIDEYCNFRNCPIAVHHLLHIHFSVLHEPKVRSLLPEAVLIQEWTSQPSSQQLGSRVSEVIVAQVQLS